MIIGEVAYINKPKRSELVSIFISPSAHKSSQNGPTTPVPRFQHYLFRLTLQRKSVYGVRV